MNYYPLSFSVLLVTIFLCCTIETLSYQLIPQRARSFFQQRKQFVSKRGFRNLDVEESESTSAYDPSKTIHLGVVGAKLQKMARRSGPLIKNSKENIIVANDINHLRKAVLDDQNDLKRVQIENYVQEQIEGIHDHQVLQLIKERFDGYSTPENRNDNSTLALAMEGGGMRGCVSAGMAAAIASLGLTGKKEPFKEFDNMLFIDFVSFHFLIASRCV